MAVHGWVFVGGGSVEGKSKKLLRSPSTPLTLFDKILLLIFLSFYIIAITNDLLQTDAKDLQKNLGIRQVGLYLCNQKQTEKDNVSGPT